MNKQYLLTSNTFCNSNKLFSPHVLNVITSAARDKNWSPTFGTYNATTPAFTHSFSQWKINFVGQSPYFKG